nr:uncharacterized protein LOC113818615 [Penaeus vannamei]
MHIGKELEAYREFERSGVKPHGPHGLENARKLLKELQHLRVREEQDQRLAKADTKSFKAFAFAGLTSSVQNLLERLDARLHEGSLGAAWRVLAESPGLRKRLEVALDHRYVAFRRADTLQTGNFGYRARLNGDPSCTPRTSRCRPSSTGRPSTCPPASPTWSRGRSSSSCPAQTAPTSPWSVLGCWGKANSFRA